MRCSSEPVAAPRRATSPRVLVVDDDPSMRLAVTASLEPDGFTIVSAGSVEEATNVAKEWAFDAALVDYLLDGEADAASPVAAGGGLRVLADLRESQPQCLRILMTGHADFPMIVEAVNRGEVLRVLQKPFNPTTLRSVVADAFASARRSAQVAYQQQSTLDLQERAMLEACIRERLLDLAVQPIVLASDGHDIVAFEALLRSRHPVLNTPSELLRVAERHQSVGELGREVFRLAVPIVAQIPENTSLFINIHPLQLLDRVALLRDMGPLGPFANRITIEITERREWSDIPGWEQTIRAISDLGFSVAIDDLGAGYSSLSMLADLQPRYIKLDMALIRNIDQEPRKQRLVQLMATFADATNANLIAEGVETPEEAETLLACGTHLLQGFYFGRPSATPAGAPAAADSVGVRHPSNRRVDPI